MRFWRNNTKSISLFVLVFLCLNAGAVLCLAKCVRPALSGHCAMAMQSDHCKRAKQNKQVKTNNDSAEAHSPTCCALPVSLLGVPVEKRVSPTFAAVASEQIVVNLFEPFVLIRLRTVETLVYRPPPLDLRGNRLRNCLIRI